MKCEMSQAWRCESYVEVHRDEEINAPQRLPLRGAFTKQQQQQQNTSHNKKKITYKARVFVLYFLLVPLVL